MTLRLAAVTFDCSDAVKLATFWSTVLDRPVDDDASPSFATIAKDDPSGPSWYFAQVPEPKTAKNRCHVALTADSRDAVATEADRLVGLGATLIRPPAEEFGHYWATLQDPEGNELCLGAP